jgi:hypothetical protein
MKTGLSSNPTAGWFAGAGGAVPGAVSGSSAFAAETSACLTVSQYRSDATSPLTITA